MVISEVGGQEGKECLSSQKGTMTRHFQAAVLAWSAQEESPSISCYQNYLNKLYCIIWVAKRRMINLN